MRTDALAQAIQEAYHRLAFHEQRLDLAVAQIGNRPMPLTLVPHVPVEAPLHHLRQILDLITHRTSECETQLSQWDTRTQRDGPEHLSDRLNDILALAQSIRRTHRQTERAWSMLERAHAQMPVAWRSQARLYRRMLTHQRQRLNAVQVRAEDFSLLAQRMRRQQKTAPVAVAPLPVPLPRPLPIIRPVLGRIRSWLTHPLVDVRLSSPVE